MNSGRMRRRRRRTKRLRRRLLAIAEPRPPQVSPKEVCINDNDDGASAQHDLADTAGGLDSVLVKGDPGPKVGRHHPDVYFEFSEGGADEAQKEWVLGVMLGEVVVRQWNNEGGF